MASDSEPSMPSNDSEKQGVAPPANQPSLLELALTKALSGILDPSFKDSDFTSLDPRQQQLLFGKLRAHTTGLQQIEQSWSTMKRWCPQIDAHLYTDAARNRLPLPIAEDAEDPLNGYTQIDAFRKIWSFADEGFYESLPFTSREIRWSTHDLVFEPPNSHLVLDDSEAALSLRRMHDDDVGRFHELISPQLLLYRLTVVFGMLPQNEDRDWPNCWFTSLRDRDGTSCLELLDERGAASAHFKGVTEASVEALRLLNFLCGRNILHDNDGVLAGVVFG